MLKLNEPYQRDNFLEFLKDFLPDYEKDVRKANFENLRTVETVAYLGRSRKLDLQVFEVSHKVTPGARMSLATDGFRIMRQSASFRALVAFYSNSVEDWRLSLMTLTPEPNEKGKVSVQFSNPRRYSFFLGPNAKVHTPTCFLINKGRVEGFDDLAERFNVEVVTKEFFNEYKRLFDKLSGYLRRDRAFQIFAEKNSINTDNFAKKLMGQIVFLYFLQRKGWLGANKGENISNGDKNFMRNYFSQARKSGQDYFNANLEPLFYNALNQRPNKAGSFYREDFGCQIPFLNGGLFEPLNNYDWKNTYLHIPDKMFSSNPDKPEEGDGILDIFDLYNFTVDESDPTDKEVSVDPEMLGKVFENLLEENLRKGKGTYYTPREIVHYMCQESLINYLITNHSNITEKNVRDYIHYSESPESFLNQKGESFTFGQYKEIDDLLQKIRIVDPACGSGAFLVAMLNLIVKLRLYLQTTPDYQKIPHKSEYELKKETIQSCIYGVDIDPGAVEIAKLRLWLSLVVDYELDDIEPLPNLDYKIMVGNSLIEILSPQLLYHSTDQARNELIDKFNSERNNYFSISDNELKRVKRTGINTLAQAIVNYDRKKEVDGVWQKILGHRNQTRLFEEENRQPTLAEAELTKEFKKLEPLNGKFSETDHFEWHLNFNEVFEEKGGFDVVIANPPWVFAREGDFEDSLKKHIVSKFLANLVGSQTGRAKQSGKINLFAIFILQSLRVLKNSGFLTYIVPNTLLRATVYDSVRKLLLDNYKIILIADLSSGVFDNVTASTIILALQNEKSDLNYKVKIIDDISKGEDANARKIPQASFLKNISFTFSIYTNEKVSSLLSKIQNTSERLDSCFDILAGGIATGPGKKKYISDKPLNSSHKPLVEGKDIRQYRVDFKNKFILYDRKKLYRAREEYLFLSPEKLITQRVGGGKNPLVVAYDDKQFYTFNSTNSIFPKKGQALSIKYLLALLNSRLLNWYYTVQFTNKSTLTVNISKTFLEQLPIREPAPEIENEILRIVDGILTLTTSADYWVNGSKQIQVREYAKQIDQMVYKLYGLTPEEIEVVERGIK